MKNTKYPVLLLMLMISVSFTAVAQTKNSLPETITSFIKALETADESALNALVSDNLSYGHSDGKVEDKKTFVANLLNGSSDFVKINTSDQSITELKHLAIVRHKLEASTNNDGKPGNVKLHVLLIWQKENGRWLLVARQATKIL